MNSIKKSLFIGLLWISFGAQAQWEPGVLLGASGGYVRDLGLYSIDVSYQGGGGATNVAFNDGEDDSGNILGVIFGLQATCSEWLIGIELRLNHFNMDHHRYFNFPSENFIGTWYVDGQIKHGNDIGLLIRLGYAMAPYFMPYMHLGAETSRDKMTAVISGSPNIFPNTIVLNQKKQIYRYTGGVGVECPAPWLSGLSFRLEYMFHMPGAFLEASGLIQDGVVNPFFTANIKPRTQSLEGAILWNIMG